MRYFTEGCFFSDNHFVDETKLFQVNKGIEHGRCTLVQRKTRNVSEKGDGWIIATI